MTLKDIQNAVVKCGIGMFTTVVSVLLLYNWISRCRLSSNTFESQMKIEYRYTTFNQLCNVTA